MQTKRLILCSLLAAPLIVAIAAATSVAGSSAPPLSSTAAARAQPGPPAPPRSILVNSAECEGLGGTVSSVFVGSNLTCKSGLRCLTTNKSGVQHEVCIEEVPH